MSISFRLLFFINPTIFWVFRPVIMWICPVAISMIQVLSQIGSFFSSFNWIHRLFKDLHWFFIFIHRLLFSFFFRQLNFYRFWYFWFQIYCGYNCWFLDACLIKSIWIWIFLRFYKRLSFRVALWIFYRIFKLDFLFTDEWFLILIRKHTCNGPKILFCYLIL